MPHTNTLGSNSLSFREAHYLDPNMANLRISVWFDECGRAIRHSREVLEDASELQIWPPAC